MGFFSCSRVRQNIPSPIPGDRVVPITSYVQEVGYNVDLLFRFDDVLDPGKLETSLERLMTIGNWAQLGARVHLKVHSIQEHTQLFLTSHREEQNLMR
jgi:hypothetical protein